MRDTSRMETDSFFERTSCDRRGFFQRASLGAFAAFGLAAVDWRDFVPVKIGRIDVYPVVYPMVGRFRFFEGPDGSPIGRSGVLVKITADDGTVGWGETVPIAKWGPETRESVTSTIRNYLAPDLIGHNVYDLAGVHRLMERNIEKSFSTGAPKAKAGVDIALHDLVGKLMNQPLAQIWGRSSGGTLTLSWTCNPARIEDLDGVIDEGLNRGYRHFNVKVAPDPAFDIELCRRVKERVPDGFLWADANGQYEPSAAMYAAPRLADVGVDVLEQPVPIHRFGTYRDLRRLGALPIAMDEGLVSPEVLIEMIRLDLLDGIAMKPARCGGLLPAKRQYEIAKDAGLMILGSGLTDPDVSLAATLALYGAFDYKLPAALNGPQFVNASVLRTPLRANSGSIDVPNGIGLGIEVDESKIQPLLVET
jgi:L-alanine-DL-glutamate epimerase-like enolase superfamily enzyme